MNRWFVQLVECKAAGKQVAKSAATSWTPVTRAPGMTCKSPNLTCLCVDRGAEATVRSWPQRFRHFKGRPYRADRGRVPFGATPSLVGVYSGTDPAGAVDLAIDPVTGTFYSSGLSKLLLYNLTLQTQEVAGDYNYSRAIWGIAAVGPAVPEPASLTLFGLGALGLAAGRRRLRRSRKD
jgi:hypothetical protein